MKPLDFVDPGHPLDLERKDLDRGDAWTAETWRFRGADDDIVTAELTVPRDRAWGAAVVAHGVMGSRDAPYIRGGARYWASHGLAVLAPDAPFHGGRMGEQWLDATVMGTPSVFVRAVVDLRRALGALRSSELAGYPLGFVGFSLGAMTGVPFLGCEPDVGAAVLMIAGSTVVMAEDAYPEWAADGLDKTASTDPATYGPQVRQASVLMMNATNDEIFNARSAQALFASLGCDKQIEFFGGSHSDWDDPATLYRRMLDFLHGRLGPGAPSTS
jgi:dienelactone hydrolase